MRVQFLITELEVGGAEHSLYHLACGVRRAGWGVEVACLDRPGPVADRLRQAEIPVLDLDFRRSPVSGWFRLCRWLRRGRPDLLHTFLFHANLIGRFAARWSGVPRIVSGVRVAERDRTAHLVLDRWTRRMGDRLVVVSEAVARFHMRRTGWHSRDVVVIPNGVDSGAFPVRLPVSREKPRILFVGRLHRQKGLGDLIRALAILRRRRIACELRIVGEGPQRVAIREVLARTGLEDRVDLVGFRSDVEAEYVEADLLCLPSRWEGMPNVVLEAMASARAVVATAVGGSPELVESGQTGLLVPPHDPEALAQGLEQLILDPGLRVRMGEAGRRRWSSVARAFVGACRRHAGWFSCVRWRMHGEEPRVG